MLSYRALRLKGKERFVELGAADRVSPEVLSLEVDLLLCSAAGLSRESLFIALDQEVTSRIELKFYELIERRAAFEPVAYILGEKEFYGNLFEVGPGVLIPRPETELLVELALEKLGSSRMRFQLVDYCVGSGCILFSILLELKRRGALIPECSGVDSSFEALKWARQNANRHNLGELVHLVQGTSLFKAVSSELSRDPLLVTCNPPYVSADDVLSREITNYEPAEALYAGEDGLDLVRKIIRDFARIPREDKTLFLEVGVTQVAKVKSLFLNYDGVEAKTHKDLTGRERVIEARTWC